MKTAPTLLQPLPPPNTFGVPTQAPPPSLLQAQLSAASLVPLLQNPPQPLLPQPPPKGKKLVTYKWNYIYLVLTTKSKLSLVCWVVKQGGASHCFSSLDVFPGGLLQPPVRMMPQPQPVRRIEPPPRYPSRNDRGPELILRTKEERRWDGDRYYLR